MIKLPARVVVQRVHPRRRSEGDASAEASTNQTDAPKTFTLKIEFVDKAGNVVGSQTVTSGRSSRAIAAVQRTEPAQDRGLSLRADS